MARLKLFKAEVGMSAEIKGTWYKFYTGVEIELDENDNPEDIKQKAWNTCHAEIERQIEAVLE
jgi:hypothetical protein